jgi:(2S)-methylsuccinyl-CoA dehydrogenase
MKNPTLADARQLSDAAGGLIERAIDRARAVTGSGKRIDDHQVLVERVAYAATQARAAAELCDAVESRGAAAIAEATCAAAVAELARSLIARLEPALDDLGLGDGELERAFPAELRALLRAAGHESVLRAIGPALRADARAQRLAARRAARPGAIGGARVRREGGRARGGAHPPHRRARARVVHPRAWPSSATSGSRSPEQYGGSEMGNLAMILTTEELSRASLAAAGSLITRPEILTKALVQGGTDEQKAHWLPKIAAGEIMVGISVTEPDIGSDVAGAKCRAERRGGDWVINGPKAWCTFAGRADVLAVLARTDPDPIRARRACRCSSCRRTASTGTRSRWCSRAAGAWSARPTRRPATAACTRSRSTSRTTRAGREPRRRRARDRPRLLPADGGLRRGRLQTSGRACGLAQAALEKTAEYVVDRIQFGTPISSSSSRSTRSAA